MSPLLEETARRRDAVGDQYAVVLVADRPLVLIEVCWGSHHAAVWLFDGQGRRHGLLEFRRLPGLDGGADRLVLRFTKQWAYESVRSAEFDTSAQTRVGSYSVSGERSDSWSKGGDSPVDWAAEAPLEIANKTRPVPEFGDWAAFVALDELLPVPVTLRLGFDASDREGRRQAAFREYGDEVDPVDVDGLPPARRPWRAPHPFQPRQLDEIFEPGARFELARHGAVQVEVVDAGRVRLPSGRLIVADPDPWMHQQDPVPDQVEPGVVVLEETGLAGDLIEVLTLMCGRLYGRGCAARRAAPAVAAIKAESDEAPGGPA